MAQDRLQRLLSESKSKKLAEASGGSTSEKEIADGFKKIRSVLDSQSKMWDQMYKGKPSSTAGAYLCLMNIVSVMAPMAQKGLDDPQLAKQLATIQKALGTRGSDLLMKR
jgi:hypothetical protein